MSDLIYRQVAIDTLIRAQEPVNNGDGTITIRLFNEGTIREAMNNIPTVDAVPVIRCKDCKYYKEESGFHNIKFMVCTLPISNHPMRKEGDFCSRAERRTDG